MKTPCGFAISASLLCFVFSPHAAEAAPAGAVLNACDNTPGCAYHQHKNGDIEGCSSGKNGSCFFCPADGKGQCFGVGHQTGGGKGKGAGVPVNIGGVKVEPMPSKGRAGTGVTTTTTGVDKTSLEKTSNKQTDQNRSGGGKRR